MIKKSIIKIFNNILFNPLIYIIYLIIIHLNLILYLLVLFSSSLIIFDTYYFIKDYETLLKNILFFTLTSIFIINFSFLPKLILRRLEKKVYAPNLEKILTLDLSKNDCIMLLGGSVSLDNNFPHIVHNPAGARSYDFINLANLLPSTHIIFSGNNIEIEAFHNVIQTFKLLKNRIIEIIPAENTFQHFTQPNNHFKNFLNNNNIKRLVLVTSAFHIPRAMELANHALKNFESIEIIPFKVDYHSSYEISLKNLINDSIKEPLNSYFFSMVMKEYFSAFLNVLKGYTNKMFYNSNVYK